MALAPVYTGHLAHNRDCLLTSQLFSCPAFCPLLVWLPFASLCGSPGAVPAVHAPLFKIVPQPIAAWRSDSLAVWQSDSQLIWFVHIAQCLRYSADPTEPLEDRLNIKFRPCSWLTVGDGQVVDLAQCHLRMLTATIPATITVQCAFDKMCGDL